MRGETLQAAFEPLRASIDSRLRRVNGLVSVGTSFSLPIAPHPFPLPALRGEGDRGEIRAHSRRQSGTDFIKVARHDFGVEMRRRPNHNVLGCEITLDAEEFRDEHSRVRL